VNNFNSKPIDRRRLNMKDRNDLNVGGGYASQQRAYGLARAYNASQKTAQNRQQRTTERTPGTGGFTQGIGLQQQRYRDIGEENQRQESNRPDLDNNIYDIYD